MKFLLWSIYWLVFCITFFLLEIYKSATILDSIVHSIIFLIFLVGAIVIKLKNYDKK